MQLLSKEEIINYKEHLNIKIDNIIPLVDLYDNIFLVYNIDDDTFAKLNITDEIIYGKTKTIENYLKLLQEYIVKKIEHIVRFFNLIIIRFKITVQKVLK